MWRRLRGERAPRRGAGPGRGAQLEADPEHLRRGPEAILHAIMDRVVDDYGPVVDGLENDIEEIEAEVFGAIPACRAGSTSSRAR